MADYHTTADVWTFLQSANQAAMRTNLGIALTQAASATLTQTGGFGITLAGVAAVTLTLPGANGTLATLAGAENLTSKTITSGTLTTCTIGSAGITFTGSSSGSMVLKSAAASSGTVTIPAGTDTLVTLTASQTLTNKTFTAPVLGVATATSINGLTITTSTGTFTLTNAKTLAVTNSLTFTGTDGTSFAFPSTSGTVFTTASGSITSLQLKTSLSDETGSGAAVFATSPVLVTPVLGAATGTSLVLSGALQCNSIDVIAGVAIATNLTVDGDIACQGTVTGMLRPALTLYGTNGAISLTSGIHHITKASAAAMTVAAPSSQDGERLVIQSGSDFAHVITFTGTTLADGTSGLNTTVTLAAFAGASLTVIARGSLWYVESQNAVTSIVP